MPAGLLNRTTDPSSATDRRTDRRASSRISLVLPLLFPFSLADLRDSWFKSDLDWSLSPSLARFPCSLTASRPAGCLREARAQDRGGKKYVTAGRDGGGSDN